MRIHNNLAGFRIGMLITMIGFSSMVPWAVGVAARVRSAEGRFPVLTHTQVGCAAIGSLIGQGATWIFEAVAYRLDDSDPLVIRALHDLAWFTFLWVVGLTVPALMAMHRDAPRTGSGVYREKVSA